MQNIRSTKELREAVHLLEIEHGVKGQVLKEEYRRFYESVKPANLIRATLNDLTSSSDTSSSVVSNAIGIATGYFSKKIIVGTSKNVFRKLFGLTVQIGVSNFVGQHPEAIKSIGQFLFQSVMQKRNKKTV